MCFSPRVATTRSVDSIRCSSSFDSSNRRRGVYRKLCDAIVFALPDTLAGVAHISMRTAPSYCEFLLERDAERPDGRHRIIRVFRSLQPLRSDNADRDTQRLQATVRNGEVWRRAARRAMRVSV